MESASRTPSTMTSIASFPTPKITALMRDNDVGIPMRFPGVLPPAHGGPVVRTIGRGGRRCGPAWTPGRRASTRSRRGGEDEGADRPSRTRLITGAAATIVTRFDGKRPRRIRTDRSWLRPRGEDFAHASSPPSGSWRPVPTVQDPGSSPASSCRVGYRGRPGAADRALGDACQGRLAHPVAIVHLPLRRCSRPGRGRLRPPPICGPAGSRARPPRPRTRGWTSFVALPSGTVPSQAISGDVDLRVVPLGRGRQPPYGSARGGRTRSPSAISSEFAPVRRIHRIASRPSRRRATGTFNSRPRSGTIPGGDRVLSSCRRGRLVPRPSAGPALRVASAVSTARGPAEPGRPWLAGPSPRSEVGEGPPSPPRPARAHAGPGISTIPRPESERTR